MIPTRRCRTRRSADTLRQSRDDAWYARALSEGIPQRGDLSLLVAARERVSENRGAAESPRRGSVTSGDIDPQNADD